MLLVLTFDGPAPRLDLVVAVGTHFRVGTGIAKLIKMIMCALVVTFAMSGSLLGHHSIEVVSSYSCRSIALIHVALRCVLLLLLEQDLGRHMLNLDESGYSIIRVRLCSPLLVRLMLGLTKSKSHLVL